MWYNHKRKSMLFLGCFFMVIKQYHRRHTFSLNYSINYSRGLRRAIAKRFRSSLSPFLQFRRNLVGPAGFKGAAVYLKVWGRDQPGDGLIPGFPGKREPAGQDAQEKQVGGAGVRADRL